MMLSIESIERTTYGSLKCYLIKQSGEFFKDFVINNIVNPTALTKSCFNIKRFVDDRICVPFLGLRFVSNLLKCFDFIKKEIHGLKYPVLMIHGLKDKICDARKAMQLYREITSVDKTKIWYTDGFHEPFSDVENEKYKLDIIKWMKHRLTSESPEGIKTIPLGKVLRGKIGVTHTKKLKRKIFLGLIFLIFYLKGIYL